MKFQEVFAWSCKDMSRIDPEIAQHHVDTHDHMMLVKQKLRRIRTEWLLKIKEEVIKQLKVGFIKPVHQAKRIANVVPVPKKDGKVRMCVDFRDLNKACPTDDFPLPHINVLVDNMAGSGLMSFKDGFSGYNKVKMAPKDMTKTTFTTKWGIYCYIVMLFGLKNSRATYQKMATTLLHNMMCNDMIVKSKDTRGHTTNLRKFFEKIQEYRLRLNP